MKEKIEDFVVATKDVAIEEFFESDLPMEMAKALATGLVSDATLTMIQSLIGGILPNANGIISAYRQNRLQRHVNKSLDVITERISEIDAKLNTLSEAQKFAYQHDYVEWLLDSFQKEKQIKKIEYYTRGFINLISPDMNENLMLMFFNTLDELTTLDIDTLKLYNRESESSIRDLMNKYNLELDQIKMIKLKLVRLNLISSKNQQKRDDNINVLIENVASLEKALKSKSSKTVSLKRTNQILRTDSYSITALGVSYLKLIEEYDKKI